MSSRFSTPVAASLLVGFTLLGLTWVYLLFTSLGDAFNNLIALTGLLYAMFYVLTALAAIAYYRRRIFSNALDAVILGILPLAAAAWLCWVLVKSLQAAPPAQIWSLLGVVGVGLVLMIAARLFLRSPFFKMRRESEDS